MAQLATPRFIGKWMLATSGAVLGIICVGGLTRLTESGLSMVDWKLIHFKSPSNDDEWNEYFQLYKKSPEYKMNNQGMSLDQFKGIYWWEHLHRVYGRILGLSIIGPSLYFIFKRGNLVNNKLKAILIGCSGLVVFQGLLGWYMVQSGLDEENVKKQQAARVSAYRLAAHLSSAVILYSTLFYSGLSLISASRINSDINQNLFPSKKLRLGARLLTTMIAATLLTGAFVAGLDAGMIYNTFPKMGLSWIPSDLWDERLGIQNMTTNPTTAQFNHRIMASGTVGSVTAYYLWARRFRSSMPKRIQLALDAMLVATWGQGLLGVLTLLYSVPVSIASAHQTGAMITLSTSLYLCNIMRPI